MKIAGIIAVAAMLSATGAWAKHKQDDASAPTAEKKICRSERVTGSLVSSNQVCMTAEEWHQLSANSKTDVEKMQRNGAISTARGGMGG